MAVGTSERSGKQNICHRLKILIDSIQKMNSERNGKQGPHHNSAHQTQHICLTCTQTQTRCTATCIIRASSLTWVIPLNSLGVSPSKRALQYILTKCHSFLCTTVLHQVGSCKGSLPKVATDATCAPPTEGVIKQLWGFH